MGGGREEVQLESAKDGEKCSQPDSPPRRRSCLASLPGLVEEARSPEEAESSHQRSHMTQVFNWNK